MENKTERVPRFDFNNLPMFKQMKIKLDCAAPVKTGLATYGEWYMWFGFVEDQLVFEGRGKDQKLVKGYTGKVIFFPSKKLNESLIAATNGNVNVEVSISKTAEETPRGLVKKYSVEKLSGGNPPSGSSSELTPGELKLIDDFQSLKLSGYDFTRTDVINASREAKYGGNITEKRAEQIFMMLK